MKKFKFYASLILSHALATGIGLAMVQGIKSCSKSIDIDMPSLHYKQADSSYQENYKYNDDASYISIHEDITVPTNTHYLNITNSKNSLNWNTFDNETIQRDWLLTKPKNLIHEKNRNLLYNTSKNPILINLMPINESSYINIYKKDIVTVQALEEIDKFKVKLDSANNIQNIDTGIDDLKLQIEESNDDLIVIFGHSEKNGKLLILPNGEEISDVEIHLYCAEKDKACMVLTCFGDDFNIDSKVSATEGLKMWNEANHINEINTITNIDFIYTMRNKRVEIEKNKKIKIYISVSGTIGGVTYYYISEQIKHEK